MFRALSLALADLGNRRVLAIMLQALLITAVIFLAFAGFLFWLLNGADLCAIIGLDACPLEAGIGGVGAILLTLLAAWFLFPAIALAVMTAFGDHIGQVIEEEHYPDAARSALSVGIVGGLGMGLRSAGRLILFNLIAAPLYILLLVTGVGPFILFVIVNGFAFGRDIGELAAARHGDRASRRDWLRAKRGEQHLLGVLVSVLFLIPFVNLVAPVLGVAAGIHLFNRSFWPVRA
jgi:uncharacterized protein involved in cysteine biosynthesis